jgi:hypothetical protein
MAEIKLIHGGAEDYGCAADLMLTDPPFEMKGAELASIIDRYETQHLVLITTMRQLVGLLNNSDWQLNFDFVIDAVMPKQSKSAHQPHYLHQTGVYLTRPGAKSVFSRKLRPRSDTFESNGYWPTIFRASRELKHGHALGKNEAMFTDLLGSFDIDSVVDPFAGSCVTGRAALELGINAILVEREKQHIDRARQLFKFIGVSV